MTDATGDSVRQLAAFGRRYAVAVRLAVVLPIAAIGVLRAPAEIATEAAVASTGLVAWTCGYALWLTRGARVWPPVVCDVAVLLAASGGIVLSPDDVDADRGPLRLLVTFAAVTYQWHTPLPLGGLAAVMAVGGLVATSAAAGAEPSVLAGQGWALVAAALSRAAWGLVLRAAARADGLAVEAERVRRASEVEAAVRADQRELANALHDTAASTFLMVGSGHTAAGDGWLEPQARRDLERLRSDGWRPPEHTDLVALLRADLDGVQLAVDFDGPDRLPLPYAVARAFTDATLEALTNVRMHAGVDRAAVRLDGDPRAFRLDVVDSGRGFRVDDVPETRRGLRHSVRGRIVHVGGTATVESAPGAGTTLRLEWRAGG